MALLGFICYPQILIAVVCFIFFLPLLRRPKEGTLPAWPFLGMLPSIILNMHHFHNWTTNILQHSGKNFAFKGPWLMNMDILLTCEPANVHHIMSQNFLNFPKGSEFNEIFEILGDGVSNVDSDKWKTQRKLAHGFINHRKFQRFVAKTSRKEVENRLIPLLELVSKQGLVVDLQDVFQRFTFDVSCVLILGNDPGCLSIKFPEVPPAKALDEAEEAIFFRHAMPESCWKLLRWLEIGKEKKMSRAWETLDHFMEHCISTRREQLMIKRSQKMEEEEDIDLLASFMEDDESDEYKIFGSKSDKYLRDTTMNLVLAGKDTTGAALTWFVWLVSKNPSVETKIIEELETISPVKVPEKWTVFDAEDLSGSVYLHGALCEALRLFPPVPFQHKHPLHPDVLPSGHKVNTNMKIVFSTYAMGRMEEIWGRDCLEFKPERWISERGGIKHEPSYKFPVFNAGPRTCLGKEMAFTQMKTVAAALIYNYRVEVVEGHPVTPTLSIILTMKHGLKVKVFKR